MYTICIALIYLSYRLRQIIIAYKENDTRLCMIILMPILFWLFFISGFWKFNLFFLLIMIFLFNSSSFYSLIIWKILE